MAATTASTPGLGGAYDVGGVDDVRRPPGSLKELDRPYEWWERQVHVLAVWLINHKLFTIDELRRATEALDFRIYDTRGYYEKWAAAITALLVEKKFLTRDDIEAELGGPINADELQRIQFKVGDTVRVLGEDDVRRWRRPHLRVPGYLHGATGTIVALIGAFDNPSYAAFAEQSVPQPLYRVAFDRRNIWGAASDEDEGEHDHDHDHDHGHSHGHHHHDHDHEPLEADVFQPWLVAATNNSPAAVDHGDHKHSGRLETECKAVAAEPEDPPLRPLASALLRLLATPGRPTQAQPQPGAPAGAAPLTMAKVAQMVDAIDVKMRAGLGARLVARAWVDAAFKERLLRDAAGAAKEMNIPTSNYGPANGGADVTLYPPNASGDVAAQVEKFASGTTLLMVCENTPDSHHLVVCTLCSCYPAAVLGLSPEWYKSRYFRARAVREPRRLLAKEFDLRVDPARRIVVHDSTAEVRYMVLPLRPAGTEGWSEEQLQAIITRDALLGVAECHVPSGTTL